jgi:hypothetical protein
VFEPKVRHPVSALFDGFDQHVRTLSTLGGMENTDCRWVPYWSDRSGRSSHGRHNGRPDLTNPYSAEFRVGWCFRAIVQSRAHNVHAPDVASPLTHPPVSWAICAPSFPDGVKTRRARNAEYSLGGEQWKAEALASNIFNYGRLTNCNSGGRPGRLSGAVAHSGAVKAGQLRLAHRHQIVGSAGEAACAFYGPGAL